MKPKRTPREERGLALKRLDIDELAATYRAAFGIPQDTRLPAGRVRETMIPAILDREFGDNGDGRDVPNVPSSSARH